MIWKGSRLHSCNFAGIVLGYCVITNVLKISEAVVNNFRRTYTVKTMTDIFFLFFLSNHRNLPTWWCWTIPPVSFVRRQRDCSSTQGEPATKQRRSWEARRWHQENNPWSGSESKRFKEAWCLRTFKRDYTGWNYWLVTYIAGPILPWSYGIRESTAEIKSKSRRKHKLLEVFDLTTTYEADIWPNELHFLTLFIKHQQTY